MSDSIEKIIEKIYQTSENIEISEFLKDLVLSELEGIGQWKETYRKKVREYMKRGDSDVKD